MALTQIDIDEDALNEAMRLSGAKTKKDTVNLALREFAGRHRRVAVALRAGRARHGPGGLHFTWQVGYCTRRASHQPAADAVLATPPAPHRGGVVASGTRSRRCAGVPRSQIARAACHAS